MITIVNTGVSNIASVLYAFERLGATIQVSDDPDVIFKSDHVVIPGVGTAEASIKNLRAKNLENCIRNLTQPILGICLGMQIMYEHSDEGNVRCLGVFDGSVTRLTPSDSLAIPHMGWNQVLEIKSSRLLAGIPDESYFYFIHSFHAPVGDEVTAVANYGGQFTAVVEKDNWFGAQFHPEKSGRNGEQLLKNFIKL